MKNKSKKYFGKTLYFVHDSLLKIVERKPIIKFNPDIPYQREEKTTKFGKVFGQFLQFGLYENTTNQFPNLVVCVNYDGRDCYKTKKEAAARLYEILQSISNHLQNKKNLKDKEIDILKEESNDLTKKRLEIEKQQWDLVHKYLPEYYEI